MFEGPGFSLLVDAINSGQNTEELEHQLAERLEKDISNEEFLEKLPLPVIVRIVKSYNHEMTFDMAKQLLIKDANVCLGINNTYTLAKEENEEALSLIIKDKNPELASGAQNTSTSQLEQEFIELMTKDLLNALLEDDTGKFKEFK